MDSQDKLIIDLAIFKIKEVVNRIQKRLFDIRDSLVSVRSISGEVLGDSLFVAAGQYDAEFDGVMKWLYKDGVDEYALEVERIQSRERDIDNLFRKIVIDETVIQIIGFDPYINKLPNEILYENQGDIPTGNGNIRSVSIFGERCFYRKN